jgi:RHS repeat-associated protein
MPVRAAPSTPYLYTGQQFDSLTGLCDLRARDEASLYGDVVLETNGSGATQASYVLGAGELLAQTRNGITSYYLADGQGSVRLLTNSSGAITDSYTYDAFGNTQSSTGSTVNPYRYTGQQFDSLIGLYSLRARYYDSASGRFTSRDTAEIDFNNPVELNRYSYVHNDPVDFSDPSGRTAAAPALPRPGAVPGGTFGEYASILLESLLQVIALAAIGTLLGCAYMYPVSILMAENYDSVGLLYLTVLDPNVPPRCHIPILKYPQRTPQIWQHIVDAQQGRGATPLHQPMLLEYLGPRSPQANLNYQAACSQARRTLFGVVESCDEYPFKTSLEGGANSSIREVPAWEQQTQGGIINGFYTSNRMRAGSLFAVVPLGSAWV